MGGRTATAKQGGESVKVRERPMIFSAAMVRGILEGRKSQTRRIVGPANGVVDGRASGKRAWDGPDGEPLDIEHRDVFVDAGPSPAGNPGPYLHVPRPTVGAADDDTVSSVHRIYPLWSPGDRLWVRETWDQLHDRKRSITYRASTPPAIDGTGWRNPMFMPRWASRITLEITEVRAQRLHEITEADAIAEGIYKVLGRWEAQDVCTTPESAVAAYRALWNYVRGQRAWDKNPWVWAISFRRTTQ